MAWFLAVMVLGVLAYALWIRGWLGGSGPVAITWLGHAASRLARRWTWLGKRRWVAAFGMPLALLIPVALVWSALLFGILVSLGSILIDLRAVLDGTGEDGLRDGRLTLLALAGLTATLGAVVAFPLTLIRLRLSAETLFNEKITEAASGLYAQRQVTRFSDEKETAYDVWEDDVVRRNAAIDRLEGLVKERPDTADRVARLLSVYVRELSRELPPSRRPSKASIKGMMEWVQSLQTARSDMESAVKVLGRLADSVRVPALELPIDLRGANLQAYDLRKLDMRGANLEKAHFEGADLTSSHLEKANLERAHLEGTLLAETHLEGAKLLRAHLDGADLFRTCFDEKTALTEASLQGATVHAVDFTNIPAIEANLSQIFGDGSTKLPAHLDYKTQWPSKWPRQALDVTTFFDELEKFRDDPDGYMPPSETDGSDASAS